MNFFQKNKAITIGRCSICNGDVTLPKIYTIPIYPMCSQCGAIADNPHEQLPIIPMKNYSSRSI